jgi:hypothetical protein
MYKILLILLLPVLAMGQQVSVQGNQLKYRTTGGIATAASKDSLQAKTDSLGTILSTEQTNVDNLQADAVNHEGRLVSMEAIDHDHANKAVIDATTASFLTADESKLDGIESGATTDQTGAEIKTLYEAEGNTNAFTDAEQTKLTGVAPGATVNSSDATLLNRVNHTGTQAISTVTGLQTAIDSKEPALGNPATNGFLLSSTTGGTRSWITAPSSGVPLADDNDWTGNNTFSENLLIGSTTDSGEKFQVTGDSKFTGDILPHGNGLKDLGGTNQHWRRLVVEQVVTVNEILYIGPTGPQYWTQFRTNNKDVMRIMPFNDTGRIQMQWDAPFTDIPSARLAVNSTTEGFLMPRLTTTQVNAISSPATGLQAYNTTLNKVVFFNGTGWRQLSDAAM